MIEILLARRSTPVKTMTEPGPSPEQVRQILTAASRVPDHNKLAPWWFVTFEGDARAAFGGVLREAYKTEDPDAGPAKLDFEAEKFLRAPLVIAVISRIKDGKAPQWEQILSAGAACYNLCLAANTLGFASNWLTEWPAYNDRVREALGCNGRDNIAGFVYIGTATDKPEDRERPALAAIANNWHDGYKPQKGDIYGKPEKGMPKIGFNQP